VGKIRVTLFPKAYDVVQQRNIYLLIYIYIHVSHIYSKFGIRMIKRVYNGKYIISRQVILKKILSLSIPRGMAQCVINFLTSRKERVKLSSCYSNWELMPAGVPQGTKLGPWLFLLMINDLRIPGVPTWKYVDDTTIAEIIPRGKDSHAQLAVNRPFPSSPQSLFQSESKSEIFDMVISCNFNMNEN